MTTVQDAQATAGRRAALLAAGHYELLAAEHAYPLTVYLRGEPQVIARPADLADFFRRLHAALRAAGLARLTARVTAEELAPNGRSRCWTDWYGAGDGAPVLVLQTVCYCRHRGGTATTEMVEVTRLDLTLPAIA